MVNKFVAFMGLLALIVLIALLSLGLTENPAYANSKYETGHYQFQAVYRAKTDSVGIFRLDTTTGEIKEISKGLLMYW